MIVEYCHDYFEECVEFTNRMNTGSDCFRYYPKDIESVRIHRKSKNENERVKTLLSIDDQCMRGLIDYNEIKTESYIQITSMFIEGDFDSTANDFFAYLKNHYKNYSGHIVINDINHKHSKFLDQWGAINLGSDYMLSITKESFNTSLEVKLEKLYSFDYEAFINLHNQLNVDVYWHGDLLVKSKNFDIYILKENNLITDYLVITNHHPINEIYFLHSRSLNNKINLLSGVLSQGFKTSEEIIYSVSDLKDLDSLKALGFIEQEKFITYELNLDTNL